MDAFSVLAFCFLATFNVIPPFFRYRTDKMRSDGKEFAAFPSV